MIYKKLRREIRENGEYKPMEYSAELKTEVLHEGMYRGYQYYVLSMGTHPTAYVEIPEDHKFYGKSYDDIDIKVHGGLTYSSDHLQDIKEDTWIIGWDYAHTGDYLGMLPDYANVGYKKWTTREMVEEAINVIEQIIENEEKE